MDITDHFVLAKLTAFFVIDDLLNRWESLSEDSKLNILIGLRESLTIKLTHEYLENKNQDLGDAYL